MIYKFHFIYLKGFGNYGSVYLVKNDKNNDFYALKAVLKQRILENRIEKHLKVFMIIILTKSKQ